MLMPALLSAQSRTKSNPFSTHKKQTNENFSKNLDHKPLSITTQYWDAMSYDWTDFADTTTITYNNDGLPQTKHELNVSGVENKTTYEYNSNGRLTSAIQLVKLTSQWDTAYIENNIYDDKGNQTSHSYIMFSSGTPVFEYKNQYENTYNTENQLTERIEKIWNEDSADYVNMNKWILTYNANGTPSSATIQEWDGSAFVNSFRVNNIVWQRWTGSIDDIEDEFGYGSLLKSNDEQTWNGTAFQPSDRFSATYDSKENLLEEKSEELVIANWEISFANNYIITYDTDSNMLTRISEEWNSDSAAYLYSTKEIFGEQNNPVGLKKQISTRLQASVYPNPATGSLNIDIPSATNVTVIITNIHGQIVSETKINNGHNQISIDGMTSGMYFYSIADSKGNTAQGKLLVQ